MHQWNSLREAYDILPKRLVYLDGSTFRTNQSEPAASLIEAQQQVQTEAAGQLIDPHDEHHGRELLRDANVVKQISLGIEEKALHSMERLGHGRYAAFQLVDEGVNKSVREIAAREISLQKQRGNWWRKLDLSTGGVIQDLRGVFDETHDEIGARVRLIFGHGETFEQKLRFVATGVWNELPALEQAQVTAFLTGRGVVSPTGAGGPEQLAEAPLAVLEEMQRTLVNAGGVPIFAPPPRSPYFPPSTAAPPATHFDRLIQLNKVIGTQAKRRLSMTMYEPQRLQSFLDGIENTHPQLYELITVKLLKFDVLNDLERDPAAMALIADLMFAFEMGDPAGLQRGAAALEHDMQTIYDELPLEEEKVPEGGTPSADTRALNDIKSKCDALPSMHVELAGLYEKAHALGAQIYNSNKRLHEANETAQRLGGGRGSGGTNINLGHSDIQNTLKAAEQQAAELQIQIVNLEKRYGTQAVSLMSSLHSKRNIPAAGTAGYRNIISFYSHFSHASPAMSNKDSLFGETEYPPRVPAGSPPSTSPSRPSPTPSGFEKFISTDFDTEKLGGMVQEVKDQYLPLFMPRIKLTAEELHIFFKRIQLFRKGNTNRTQATRRATYAVRRQHVEAENVTLDLLVNAEIAQHRGDTILGQRWLSRFWKKVQSKVSPESMMTARHIIDRATIDQENPELGAFAGMPADITPIEFRKLCGTDSRINAKSLKKFSLKLRTAMQQVHADNPDHKIEILDSHALMLSRLVRVIQVIQMERDCDEVVRLSLKEGGDASERAYLNDKNFIRLLRTKREEWAKREDEILEGLFGEKAPKWLEWFRDLKKSWFGKAQEEVKAEKGLSSGEREAYRKRNNTNLLMGSLSTALAMKEGFDTVRSVSKWTRDSVLKPGASGVGAVAGGVGRGIGTVGKGVWNKGIVPVARVTGTAIAAPFKFMGRLVAKPFKRKGRGPSKGWWKEAESPA